MFNFSRAGSIVVEGAESEEAVFEAAMEAGAEDVAPVPEDEEGKPSTSYKVCVHLGVVSGVGRVVGDRLEQLDFRFTQVS